jgi:thymidylate kinase
VIRNNQVLVYLCGPHTAGKTSILKSLQGCTDIDYTGDEIGKKLFYEKKFNTEKQNEDFELEITRLELERDALILQGNYKIAVVESWHVGNLAYAMVRNPHSIDALTKLISASPLLKKSYGIWLRVSKENIFNRTKTFSTDRKWASEFYTLIDLKIESCFETLGLTSYCILDADRELDKNTNDVHNIIQSVARGKLCQCT